VYNWNLIRDLAEQKLDQLGATSEALMVARTTAKYQGGKMGNKSTAGFGQQNHTAEPKLEHAYAHIGIFSPPGSGQVIGLRRRTMNE
jgi:hypothetical protein